MHLHLTLLATQPFWGLHPHTQYLACRSRLSGLPGSHVWPFQRFFHTDKAAYLIRQHIFSNLYHRLSTRPFLASVEKVGS